MGFTGTFVVLRHEAAPADLVPVDACEAGSGADICGGSVHNASDWEPIDGEWPDGWRVWQVFGELPTGDARALMKATSAPVLTAHVLHSDGARVEGLGPRTGRWAAWLMVWGAVQYFDVPVDFDDDEVSEEEARQLYEQAELAAVERLLADAPGGPATARQAVAWAEEAGLVASADAVLAALDGHRVFAEELVFDLLVRLGLRRAVPSAAGT